MTVDYRLITYGAKGGKGARTGAAECVGLAAEADQLGVLEERGFPEGVPVTFLAAAQAEAGTEKFVERYRRTSS